MGIPELCSFANGIETDITAVTNAFLFELNNGLVEDTVNKNKVTKRIMYGRCSFGLLKAKLLGAQAFFDFN